MDWFQQLELHPNPEDRTRAGRLKPPTNSIWHHLEDADALVISIAHVLGRAFWTFVARGATRLAQMERRGSLATGWSRTREPSARHCDRWLLPTSGHAAGNRWDPLAAGARGRDRHPL